MGRAEHSMSGPLTEYMMELLNSRLNLDREPVTEEEIQALRRQNAPRHFSRGTDATERRIDAVGGLVRKTLTAAVYHLGEKEALRIWAQAAKKRRGAKTGSREPDKDQRLLWQYDEMREAEPTWVRRLPRMIGEYMHRTKPGEYGQSASSIETHVRRLLKKRLEAAERSAPFTPSQGALTKAGVGGMTPAPGTESKYGGMIPATGADNKSGE